VGSSIDERRPTIADTLGTSRIPLLVVAITNIDLGEVVRRATPCAWVDGLWQTRSPFVLLLEPPAGVTESQRPDGLARLQEQLVTKGQPARREAGSSGWLSSFRSAGAEVRIVIVADITTSSMVHGTTGAARMPL
jgi:hypothetical protein